MNNFNVKTGLDLVLHMRIDHLRGTRVGLLCHPASVDSKLRHAVELFSGHGEFKLAALFGPQHGILGNTQDNMIEWGHMEHPWAGVPAYSLYSETRKPTPEMLKDIDVLVCDMQDVGTRVYTFIWTMLLCMRACAEAGKPMIVLDRPNPIGGAAVEGNVLEPGMESFVGMHTIPMRHGMTCAELAEMFNSELAVGCDLHVVPMEGWRRDMYFEETGLPWVLPSPNMPTNETAVVYPGTVLYEGVEVSEGRGTTRPFELIGAPWLDSWKLAGELNSLHLPGVHFRPAHFEPTFHKHVKQICGGVQLHVTDRERFKPFLSALALLREIHRQSPEKLKWKQPPYEYEHEKQPIDVILGSEKIRPLVMSEQPLAEVEKSWAEGLDDFMQRRSKFLIY